MSEVTEPYPKWTLPESEFTPVLRHEQTLAYWNHDLTSVFRDSDGNPWILHWGDFSHVAPELSDPALEPFKEISGDRYLLFRTSEEICKRIIAYQSDIDGEIDPAAWPERWAKLFRLSTEFFIYEVIYVDHELASIRRATVEETEEYLPILDPITVLGSPKDASCQPSVIIVDT